MENIQLQEKMHFFHSSCLKEESKKKRVFKEALSTFILNKACNADNNVNRITVKT